MKPIDIHLDEKAVFSFRDGSAKFSNVSTLIERSDVIKYLDCLMAIESEEGEVFIKLMEAQMYKCNIKELVVMQK